jgi:hypothetical protein
MILVVVGSVLLAAVFAGIFALTVQSTGWRVALVIWAAAVVITGVIVAATFMISAGLAGD